MPKAKAPTTTIMEFFRTQPQEACTLVLSIIQHEVKARFAPDIMQKKRGRPRKVAAEPTV